ncbi:MAG: putative inorganic carbon transporter subunit DabA, partial [Isosphaeraceae bacterium]
MPTSAVRPATTAATAGHDEELEHLRHVIEHAAHLLPAQGPITVFIHHNTLHAFEDLPFNEAVKKGAQVFGCQPYLSEDRYRQELLRGRIRFDELREALEQDLGRLASEEIPCFGSRLDLRLAMLQYPLRIGPPEELVWYVAEADAMSKVRAEISAADRVRLIAETRRWVVRDLRGQADAADGTGQSGSEDRPRLTAGLAELLTRFDDSRMETWTQQEWERFTLQALWRVCCDGVRGLPAFTPRPPEPTRHRDLLLEAAGRDADLLVHEHLIRFCAAFLDQGLAHWPLPYSDLGFFRSYCRLYRQAAGPPDRWMRGLAPVLARLEGERVSPLEVIRESLGELGVQRDEWDLFLSATLLALRGWAGMIH